MTWSARSWVSSRRMRKGLHADDAGHSESQGRGQGQDGAAVIVIVVSWERVPVQRARTMAQIMPSSNLPAVHARSFKDGEAGDGLYLREIPHLGSPDDRALMAHVDARYHTLGTRR